MSTDTVEIPQRIARRIEDPTPRQIPAIIHQTFETKQIPKRMYEAGMTWSESNPAFEYRYHTDEDCRAFIVEHFEPEVVAAYDKLVFGAARADLWRYCMLWIEGGVYADIDTVCRTDLREIIDPDTAFITSTTGSGNTPFAAFNAFICAAPRHPFMKASIERATRRIHNAEQIDTFMDTGPGNLGIAINQSLGRADRHPHNPGAHQENGQHYRFVEKVVPETGPRCVMDGETVVFLTKYHGYLDDLKSTGKLHWADYIDKPGFLTRLRRVAKRKANTLFGQH